MVEPFPRLLDGDRSQEVDIDDGANDGRRSQRDPGRPGPSAAALDRVADRGREVLAPAADASSTKNSG